MLDIKRNRIWVTKTKRGHYILTVECDGYRRTSSELFESPAAARQAVGRLRMEMARLREVYRNA